MTGYGNSNRPGGSSGPSGAWPPQGSGRRDTGNSADRGRIEDLLRPPTEPVGYFSGNDKKAIETRLLGEEAEKVAKKLAEVPASQLRRFYAEVMALKRRAELAGASDKEIRAQLTLLRANAAYTWQRQGRYPGELVAFFAAECRAPESAAGRYPGELVAFFTRHAASVQTREDFLRGFQPHFEAVMASHKVFEKKKDHAA
ncbi:MAG: type III-A CRISPR-associated protein Csm2 [Elioraea sp.]|nr:type III-A CRISPR-associated protein Csm2 [Elioraea sp.]